MAAPAMSLSDAVSGGFSGLTREFGALQAKDASVSAEQKKAAEDESAALGKSETEREEVVAAAKQPGGGLTPPTLAPAPKAKPTQPLEVWGSAAMWAAALGGLLTRRPLMNSMNAMASVVGAFRQQDSEAAKQAFETWKVENDNAIKMFEFANASLKDQLSAINESETAKFRNYQIVAQSLGDQQAASAKSFDEAFRLVEARERHKDEMAKATPEMELKYTQLQLGLGVVKAGRELQAAQQTKDPAKITAATEKLKAAQQDAKGFNEGLGKGGSALNAGDYSEDAVKLAATEYRMTGKMPALGMGGGEVRAQIINEAAQQAKQMGMSNEEVVALQAGVGSDTAALRNITRIASASAAFENTAMKNFENALRLAKKGGIPTDAGPFINKWVQEGQTALGSKDVPPYIAALLTGANEYAKVISGSTGSQGSTVDSRKEAASMFSGAYDYDTIKNVIYNVAKPDMDNKKNSYRDMQGDLLHAIGTGRLDQTVVSGNEAFKPDPAWPPAKGVPDGKVLKDEQGQVVARAKGGEWGPP